MLRASYQEDFRVYERALLETRSGSPPPITQEDLVDRLVEKVLSEGINNRTLLYVGNGTLSGLETKLLERAIMRVQQERGGQL